MGEKKRVRILLRVSSNQQLEADGDLSVQRQLIMEFIKKHQEWELDKKEYFEGSNSGYKNAVSDRNILREILDDAQNKEFDLLIVYKDDRLGRRMWEIGAYVMELKNMGIDIHTVKDGCISPENDDIMGQMMLALRYGNAQKSSSDTGMRVKDTAQKLVQKGKFMGGKAPYGYKLELSGEISKHGRALKHLVIVPEQADVVKKIYQMSLCKEYGSTKIARILNEDDYYRSLAPIDVWKSGTITSILTNPIYSGHTAYKRREKVNNSYHKLDSEDWITSDDVNIDIQTVDEDTWNKVQRSRGLRNAKYVKPLTDTDVNIIKNNNGELPLIDILYCGYCGRKFTNGTKYNYWSIKSTGEKRASKIAMYRCQGAQQGIPHNKIKSFRADVIEPLIFEEISDQIGRLQENEAMLDEISRNQKEEHLKIAREIDTKENEIKKVNNEIDVMEKKIPESMTGEYPLSLEELTSIIKKHKVSLKILQGDLATLKSGLQKYSISSSEIEQIKIKIPEWKNVFLNADTPTKRVLVNKLISRIDITKDDIIIKFKINIDYFLEKYSKK